MSKAAIAFLILSCLALTAFSVRSAAAPGPPAPQGLYVAYIYFDDPHAQPFEAQSGAQVTVLAIVVHNGTGDSPAANISFFCDGSFLGLMPVPAIKAPDNFTYIHLLWDTAGWPPGAHNLTASLEAPGHPEYADNGAVAKIVLHERPALSIELDQPHLTIDAGRAGPFQECFFSGNVTLNRSGTENLTVDLNAYAGAFQRAAVEPSVVEFGPGNGSRNFTVSTSNTGWDHNGWSVAITASAGGPGFSVQAETYATVSFWPYTALVLFTDTPYVTIGTAKKTVITFSAENRGNREASFVLGIENERKLLDSGWELRLSPDHITLQPGEAAEVTLTAEYTREWPPAEAVFPVYDYQHIGIRATAADGSMSTTGEVTLERQGYNGRSLLLMTAAVAAATIGFLLLPLKWPRRGRPHGRKALLAMYWASTFALAVGLSVVLLSLGLYYSLSTENGEVESSGGSWGPGALVLPFALPFILIGTYVLLWLFADGRSRDSPRPYLLILAAEAVFLIAFMPYPMGFFHATRWGFSDATINITPMIDNWGPFFILLFLLVFSAGWAFWYLFRPESWPLGNKKAKGAEGAPGPGAPPAGDGPEGAAPPAAPDGDCRG